MTLNWWGSGSGECEVLLNYYYSWMLKDVKLSLDLVYLLVNISWCNDICLKLKWCHLSLEYADCIFLQKGKIPPKEVGYPGYDNKLQMMMKPQLWS